jgi:hypothetical protein
MTIPVERSLLDPDAACMLGVSSFGDLQTSVVAFWGHLGSKQRTLDPVWALMIAAKSAVSY